MPAFVLPHLSRVFLGVALWGLLGGCGSPRPAGDANGHHDATEGIALREVAAEMGIDYRPPQPPRPLRNLEAFGTGCGFVDYDGDGWQDIVLVARPHPLLYRNVDQGRRFEDVTVNVGLDRLKGYWTGVAAGDMDGDGRLDLLFTGYRRLSLMRGRKDQPFVEVTAKAGLASDNRKHWGSSASLSDLDADGDDDLIHLNYVIFNEKEPQFCELAAGVRSGCPPSRYRPEFGEIWRNTGDGRFEDVSARAGMKTTNGKALVVAQCDVNGDRRPDLYIGNDGTPAELLINRGGMRFENQGMLSGIAFGELPGQSLAAMGADWADFDRDGRLDLAVSAFADEPYALFKQEPGSQFTHLGEATGLSIATLKSLGFGTKWLDLENDGWPDLVITNGHVYDRAGEIDPQSPYRQPLMLFRNVGGKTLDNIAPRLGGAIATGIVGRGLATGDFDNDGRVDVLVSDLEGPPLLLHNITEKRGHFLTLDLRRKRGKSPAVGAEAVIEAGGQRFVGQSAAASSYLSTSDPRIHFGLGETAEIDKLTVRWPSGRSQVVMKPPVDQILTIKEPSQSSAGDKSERGL